MIREFMELTSNNKFFEKPFQEIGLFFSVSLGENKKERKKNAWTKTQWEWHINKF